MRCQPDIRLPIIAVFGLLLSFSVFADGLDLKALILMPGPVIEAHAEEEKNCEVCHSSFDKTTQDSLCIDCHENVALDRDQNTGFHGQAPSVMGTYCKGCHKEHKGRKYNSIPLDQDTFEHQYTDFKLSGKHIGVACDGCHQDEVQFRDTPGTCHSCHEKQDVHRESLGNKCATCHSPDGWHELNTFDHNATNFPLKGQHDALQCASCHAGEQYTFEAVECVSCHRVHDVHLGRYGEDCERCHSETDWASQFFDHAAETDFALTGAHQKQACQACHLGHTTENSPATDCASCHRSSDIHAGRHGQACDSCHTTKNWGLTQFDHSNETSWPLRGEHKKASCLQCHRGALDDGLQTACRSCHEADDVHRSEELEDCSSCHTAQSWSQTADFDHELTRFPLEGMHANTLCQGCHQGYVFHQVEASCVDCHRYDDIHDSALGQACEACHGPNGWSLWSFDHSKQTDFELSGTHAGLSCGSCHHGDDADDVAGSCAGCHSGDDRHVGNFGNNCGRCHSSDSFGDIQWRN